MAFIPHCSIDGRRRSSRKAILPSRVINRLEKKVDQLNQKLVKKNEVLSELMEEHVKLKKNIGEI